MVNEFVAMSDLCLKDKRVLIRQDLNVPMDSRGYITSDARIRRALPTIEAAMEAGARVVIASHLGRPKEGDVDKAYSLAPVAQALSERLGHNVSLINDYLSGVEVACGQVVLLENMRFNIGEKVADESLSRQLAELCDIFVMDAFATAHRAEASTVGIAKYAPVACAGPLLEQELQALSLAFSNPERPLTAIVGGSKVSTKFCLLEKLLSKVDQLMVGGGIANTFLKAAGFDVGASLYEPGWVEAAKKLLALAKQQCVDIPLPTDVVVAPSIAAAEQATIRSVSQVKPDEAIFDVGPETAATYHALMAKTKSLIWNGPVGVFEVQPFSYGTRALALAVAASDAYTVAGGGDTVAALAKFGLTNKITYISTGGGAFLEYLQGAALPALSILQQRFFK